MKKVSLKLRLIFFFILIASVVFSAAAYLSWKETKETIDEFFDTYQMALARQLSSSNWQHISSFIQMKTDELIEHVADADTEDEAIGFAVFTKSGERIFHDNENGKKFVFRPKIGSFDSQKIDDEAWRIIWLDSADGLFIIAVGQELDFRQDIAWDMAEEFMLPWALGIFILLTSTILIITYEFLPLGRLAKSIQNRAPEDLSALPNESVPKEIEPLIDAMNKLLDKVKKMVEREQSFIADSAHELRTPLTALKIQLEIVELAKDDEKMKNQALKNLKIGIERSARLVEQLLALSKAQSVRQTGMQEIINWPKIVNETIDVYQAAITEKKLKLEMNLTKDGPITKANPLLVSLIVRNLIDNAIKYSPAQATVHICVKDRSLTIINSNSHLKQDVLSHLGQRFYRPAGQKETGSGLGLSIVERIAALYGCTVSYQNTLNGFEVTVKA